MTDADSPRGESIAPLIAMVLVAAVASSALATVNVHQGSSLGVELGFLLPMPLAGVGMACAARAGRGRAVASVVGMIVVVTVSAIWAMAHGLDGRIPGNSLYHSLEFGCTIPLGLLIYWDAARRTRRGEATGSP